MGFHFIHQNGLFYHPENCHQSYEINCQSKSISPSDNLLICLYANKSVSTQDICAAKNESEKYIF